MGYTHYFTFNRVKGIPADELEAAYKAALIECAHVARAYQATAVGLDRLSGYTAHTKPGAYGGLQLNGKGENAHEPFELREHFGEQADNGFGFCKTARKPYDIVVVACLAVLKYRLGNAIDVSSDGRESDWKAGVALAQSVLNRRISNPLAITEPVNRRGLKLVVNK